MAGEATPSYDEYQYCTAEDSGPLVVALEHYAAGAPTGVSLSPLVLEPEPGGVRKRRFRSDVDDVTGFVAQFHFERSSAGGVAGALALETADQLEPDDARDALAGPAGVGLPYGWELDEELLDAGVIALNSTAVSDGASGPWAIAALVALGAPVPTGRWRFILPTLPRFDGVL